MAIFYERIGLDGANQYKDPTERKRPADRPAAHDCRISSETAGVEELLKLLSKMIVDQFKADSALIYLFDDSQEELVLRGAHNPHPQQLGRIKMKLGEGITGWVAEKKKPVSITRKASDDSRFKFFTNLKEDKYEAFLSVAGHVERGPGGRSERAPPQAAHSYPAEIEMAQTIAHEIAGAIAHAQIHHQSHKKSSRSKRWRASPNPSPRAFISKKFSS